MSIDRKALPIGIVQVVAGGSSGSLDISYGFGNLTEDGYNFMATLNVTRQQELQASQRTFASTGDSPARGLVNINGATGPAPGSYTDASGNFWQVGYPGCAGNRNVVALSNVDDRIRTAPADQTTAGP